MRAHASVDFGYLREIVFCRSRNVLDPSRDYLFATRLTRLLRSRGLEHLQELVAVLRRRQDAALEQAIAEAMTINETSFFRDGRPFELLRTGLLPNLIESRRHTRALRFWSAACATGQEAYSVAIMMREYFGAVTGWNIRVEGTDICREAVARAQEATYSRIEMNRGLPARFIVRHFDHAGESWTVKPDIRQMCNFRQVNLCAPPLPFRERFDVILLRNVMLYFSAETRRALLADVHRMLAPDGVLFLGSSEQPTDLSLWTPVLAGGTCYFKPRRTS